VTPLEREIRALIAANGPISVARYMQLCLGHPLHGYYATRDPFGAGGDFVTAPEISQVFGELLGIWAASVFESMPQPGRVLLVELGPGRGTLMADALRAMRVVPGLLERIDVHLVETSPTLREKQRATLAGAGVPVAWHDRLDDVPAGPMVLLANEFLDALPIRQFVLTEAGWRERLVGIGADGSLAFGLDREKPVDFSPPAATGSPGAVVEISPDSLRIAAALGRRVALEGGAALFIDYGYEGFPTGDSLQAVRGHRFVEPLQDPGTADLTAHVAFASIALAGRAAGAAVHGPVIQAQLLEKLGLSVRTERLAAGANAAQAEALRGAAARLTDTAPTGMGSLFKALCLADPRLPVPPGFSFP
jgi:SAM-dependent MidA family methyltransferase